MNVTGAQGHLLDANVFIEAAKGYYAFDIAPPFWEALITQATAGRVLSIDRVKDEIDKGKDELKEWAHSHFHQWFDSTDADDVTGAYRNMMVWAFQQGQFTDPAKAEFATKADAWVVAYAVARECAVVTLEKFDPKCLPGVQRPIHRYLRTAQNLRS